MFIHVAIFDMFMLVYCYLPIACCFMYLFVIVVYVNCCGMCQQWINAYEWMNEWMMASRFRLVPPYFRPCPTRVWHCIHCRHCPTRKLPNSRWRPQLLVGRRRKNRQRHIRVGHGRKYGDDSWNRVVISCRPTVLAASIFRPLWPWISGRTRRRIFRRSHHWKTRRRKMLGGGWGFASLVGRWTKLEGLQIVQPPPQCLRYKKGSAVRG